MDKNRLVRYESHFLIFRDHVDVKIIAELCLQRERAVYICFSSDTEALIEGLAKRNGLYTQEELATHRVKNILILLHQVRYYSMVGHDARCISCS